jgi:hypothetical protein
MMVRAKPDPKRISHLQLLRSLCPLSIHLYFTAFYRIRGESARLEEARGPKPFIQPNTGRFVRTHPLRGSSDG